MEALRLSASFIGGAKWAPCARYLIFNALRCLSRQRMASNKSHILLALARGKNGGHFDMCAAETSRVCVAYICRGVFNSARAHM